MTPIVLLTCMSRRPFLFLVASNAFPERMTRVIVSFMIGFGVKIWPSALIVGLGWAVHTIAMEGKTHEERYYTG